MAYPKPIHKTSSPKKVPPTPLKALKSIGDSWKSRITLQSLSATAKTPWLWQGPHTDGVTYSLLCKFLVCRERFRLKVQHGIVPDQGFSHAMEFGSLWHACEEAAHDRQDFKQAALKYAKVLYARYPNDKTQIDYWTAICLHVFPVYWSQRQSTSYCSSVLQEMPFRVPAPPVGRNTVPVNPVYLRGKFDAIHIIDNELWLQENKTKGDIDPDALSAVIDKNFQTMIYLWAILYCTSVSPPIKSKTPEDETHRLLYSQHAKSHGAVRGIGGTIYNVVRRPLSSRHSIKQKKKESQKEFFQRIAEDIASKPNEFFFRWTKRVSQETINCYARDTIAPICASLAAWYALMSSGVVEGPHHWTSPFGVYNSLGNGLRGDYWDLLSRGSTMSLTTISDLFPELKVEHG